MQQGARQTFSVSSRVDKMKIHKQLKLYIKKEVCKTTASLPTSNQQGEKSILEPKRSNT
jgi:hypothetical protein